MEPSILQVVLMGLITVFVVLICLIVLIKILGAIMVKVKGNEAPAPVKAQAPAVSATAVPANAVPATAAPGENRGELVAAISAAIAEEMGTDPAHLRIHSIRRV